jgi:hypothetical protein
MRCNKKLPVVSSPAADVSTKLNQRRGRKESDSMMFIYPNPWMMQGCLYYLHKLLKVKVLVGTGG